MAKEGVKECGHFWNLPDILIHLKSVLYKKIENKKLTVIYKIALRYDHTAH